MDVQRVFLGAQLLGDAADRRAAITELTGRSNAEIAAGLSADGGYTELGELDAQRAEHVGAAYRHDCVSAHRYFADALDTPPAVKLSAPVTVVVAADDPSTAEFPRAAPRLAAPGRARRPARARRRRPLLPAHPPDRGGAGRAARRRSVRLFLSGNGTERTSKCRPHPRRHCSTWTCSPASPRCCGSQATGDAPSWAAEHRDALRAAVAEHGCGPGPRPRAARRGRGRRRLPAAGHRSDDREGGLRGPAAATPTACTPRRSGRRTSRCACTTS